MARTANELKERRYHRWFNQELTVTPYVGDTGTGPKYGDPYIILGRFEEVAERIVDRRVSNREQIVYSSGKVFTFADSEIPLQSILSHNGTDYRVVEVREIRNRHRVVHKEVMLL